jgi:RHS repeat-associated protein
VYYPFGEEATAFNQDTERMKFTGHERDLASLAGAGDDLDYMHARHCSPVTGRFLSVDPLYSSQSEHPQSWNKNAYVRDNPLNHRDPDGKCVEDACIGEFLAAGALVDCVVSSAATAYVVGKIHEIIVQWSESKEKDSSNRTEHGEDRAREASEGDTHRQVGDPNRVGQEGRELKDAETGNRVFVRGNKVVITDEEGKIITQFKNSKANTLKRILELFDAVVDMARIG